MKHTSVSISPHFRGGQVLCFGAHDTGAARRREDAARPHTALTSFACKGLLKYCVFDTFFSAIRTVFCPDDACEGYADGWGVRACAVALTVGLIFWSLFYQEKSDRRKLHIGKYLCILSVFGKYEEKNRIFA